MALDRDQPADAEQARLGARVRGARRRRRDPVVDDLEVLLVEALRLGEVLREPPRDRDVHVRERADGAVGEPEPAPFPELVEAVLRREPERHARRASRRAGRRRRRGRGACAGCAGGHATRYATTSPNAIGSTSARSRTSSSGTPRARSSRANSHAPGSSSCSMRKRTSQPRSRRSGRSWSRCASEPEMPATFWMWRTTPSVMRARRVEDATRPRLHRVARLDALAKPPPERRALVGARAPRARGSGRRARAGPRAGSSCVRVEQRVEDRVRGEHRQAACRSLVDDLVRRAGAHVVDERVVRREERGISARGTASPSATRPSSPSSADEPLELRAMRALLVGERRAVDVEPTSVAGARRPRASTTSSPFAGE